MNVLDWLLFYVSHEILPSTDERRVQLRDSVIEEFLQTVETGAEATPEALHSSMRQGLGEYYIQDRNRSQLPSQMVNALQHRLGNREFAENHPQRRRRRAPR